MNKELIVRAWKDPEFRASLSPEQRATLPECPSGQSITELDDTDLDSAVGGRCPNPQTQLWCPTHAPMMCINTRVEVCHLPPLTV